jgi:uncharacterized RmlC-like cupin family protein
MTESRAVRHVAVDRTSVTTSGDRIQRIGAISGAAVGAKELWMGEAHLGPGADSGNHHHGESETAVYVVSGHPVFVFVDADGNQQRITAEPGDYVFVPAWLPHREENPDPQTPAVVVLARSTQEAIVVPVERLG